MKNNDKKLALFGGNPCIKDGFKRYNPYGSEELEAAEKVILSGVLSDFYGTNSDKFYGGENVRAFEAELARFYGVEFAITFNSWTSGLIAAVGAIDLEPGDEIIVPTWTMTATAMAVLHWNCIPIFADIDPNTFNIDPNSIRKNITNKTKAIIAVDIFGLPADLPEIRKIADEFSLKIINDSAQSPLSKINGKYVGTESDIGGFSLNYHKHFHTGEGGVIITNDESLHRRACLIRNHGEACLNEGENISNILGHNFRMGEIEAAMGREQLRKIDFLVKEKNQIANQIITNISHLDGLSFTKIPEGFTHSYYVLPIVFESEKIGISRNLLAKALAAEGVPLSEGYQNIHLLPVYQEKIAYGKSGIPWSLERSRKGISYEKGICPIAENLHDKYLFFIPICSFDLNNEHAILISKAFEKVWSNLDLLKSNYSE